MPCSLAALSTSVLRISIFPSNSSLRKSSACSTFDGGADRGLSYETLTAEWETDDNPGISSYQAFKETQYDLLAEAVRKHLDMDQIYEIILKQ